MMNLKSLCLHPLALCIAPFCLLSSIAIAEEVTFRSLAVGATPESVVKGFDGKLYVTLMGTKREKGDGIVHDEAGNLYLTEVKTGNVWHIKAAS